MAIKFKSYLIPQEATIKQAMKRMSEVGEKEVLLADSDNRLVGAVSDGDIRKWILKEGSIDETVYHICNKTPKLVKQNFSTEDVKKMMLTERIECIPVVNANNEVIDILLWDEVFGGKVSKHKEKLAIPVVVMAGGKGTRLDPFTRILPKPLIPIGEKPIIEIIMSKFTAYQINDFYISINHKSRMIRSYFEETNDKCNIRYIEEKIPLGTAGSLKLLEGKIKGSFFVTNCDIIIESDYAELLKFHRENRYDLTMVMCYRHFVIPYGVCEIENGGTLKSITEKPSYDFFVNTGMYVVNDNILKLIPKNRSFNMTDLVLKAQKEGLRIGAYPINEHSWVDIGQWEEYKKTIQDLNLE